MNADLNDKLRAALAVAKNMTGKVGSDSPEYYAALKVVFAAVESQVATPAPQAAPSEHKLVPVDPTPEMIEAGARDGVQGDFDNDLSNGVKELSRAIAASGYRAMLAAAPAVAITQAATSGLQVAIMNLPCKPGRAVQMNGAMLQVYKEAHRDARHAAAELAGTTPNTEAPSDEPDWRAIAEGHALNAADLEQQLAEARAALSAQQAGVQEAHWKHIANEWADVATNGLQWLKNAADGCSTLAEGIEAMQRDIASVRAALAAMGDARKGGAAAKCTDCLSSDEAHYQDKNGGTGK